MFESYTGYMSSDHTFVIAVPCAGVNFLITAFLMLALRRLWRERFQSVSWRFLPIGRCGVCGDVDCEHDADCYRAGDAERAVEVSGLTENQLHRLEGIVVYFGFLMLLFVVMERRLLMFPVVIYYVMTLGVPLVNGAFHRAGFWEHFGFVLVMPLVVMLPFLMVSSLLDRMTGFYQDVQRLNRVNCVNREILSNDTPNEALRVV